MTGLVIGVLGDFNKYVTVPSGSVVGIKIILLACVVEGRFTVTDFPIKFSFIFGQESSCFTVIGSKHASFLIGAL